jgi:hypothetical protein
MHRGADVAQATTTESVGPAAQAPATWPQVLVALLDAKGDVGCRTLAVAPGKGTGHLHVEGTAASGRGGSVIPSKATLCQGGPRGSRACCNSSRRAGPQAPAGVAQDLPLALPETIIASG